MSLDMDTLCELQDQIGESSNDFKFRYLNDKLEHLDQLEEYDVVVSPANSFGELKGGIDYYFYKLLGGNKLQSHVYDAIKSECQGEIAIGETLIIDLGKFSVKYNKTPNQAQEFNSYTGMPRFMYMCPTMTIPMDVNGTRNAYLFMKTLIKNLLTHNRQLLCNLDGHNRQLLCNLDGHNEGKLNPELKELQSNLGIPSRIDQSKKIKKVLVPLPCVGVGRMHPSVMAKQIKVAIQAYEGKGIIPAIFMKAEDEKSFRDQKLYEYQPDNVLQNARMACIQMSRP